MKSGHMVLKALICYNAKSFNTAPNKSHIKSSEDFIMNGPSWLL